MTAQEILNKYIEFFKKQKHVQIVNSSLVPENDPTTLFTSSGMQPLVPYLLGEPHPQGKRLVNAQNCFRAQDIDEIGDNRHTTFFRMLGNWSLGDYFKKEQINWIWEFLTGELGLDKNKLYISVFEGFKNIPKDTESYEIWAGLLKKDGLKPEEKISYYGVDKNWWSRSGTPDKMPVGEPGGPDTEIFFDFGTEHDPKFGDKCDPNCQCGRFMEIGNSVFMQYLKTEKGFQDLPKQNVDFGGGLERLVAATENKQDIFETSLFAPIIKTIERVTGKEYSSNSYAMRIIADHLIASVFIAAAGVYPSNKEQGYVLRRLLRRAIRYGKQLGVKDLFTVKITEAIIESYANTDNYLLEKKEEIGELFEDEEKRFSNVIDEGLKKSEEIIRTKTPIPDESFSKLMQEPQKNEMFRKIYKGEHVNLSKFNLTPAYILNATISGKQTFDLYQSFGFPIEMVVDLAQEKRLLVDIEAAREEIKKHQELSRSGSAQKFTGGLADHSEKTIMGHTATHLLHKALRDIFGESLHQAGSNITPERVRFDYNFDRKLTPEEIKKIEDTVNEKIKENLPVHFEIMPLSKAKEIGAIGLFDEKYADNVKVYFVGDYSAEFCGGPHVDFTGEIKRFKIIKEEALGRSLRRIYAVVGD